MVAARCGVKDDVFAGRVEDGGYDGDVWEMGASGNGMVGDKHIARHEGWATVLVLVLDCVGHTSKMHRDVCKQLDQCSGLTNYEGERKGEKWSRVRTRCVRDQIPAGSKNGTGEVKPLLNVDADSRLLQSPPHLLCNRHESYAR